MLLAKAESWHESEDHIALELDFMATFAMHAARALRKGGFDEAENPPETQQSFLADHLAPWVPVMCKGMRKFAKTKFTRDFHSLLRAFCKPATSA